MVHMRLEQETTLTNFFQNVFVELYTYLWFLKKNYVVGIMETLVNMPTKTLKIINTAKYF